MPNEPDHLLLRRYADARELGRLDAAAELWKRLAVNNFDRVTQIVKAFRFTPGGAGIPDHEWGSAANEAYIRVVAMGADFRKREVGQFYAALAAYDVHLRGQAREAVEGERDRLEAEQLVAWAIGEVANDNYREVLAMTYQDQLSGEQIVERLGITPDNMYARRSRGLKELERILRDLRS